MRFGLARSARLLRGTYRCFSSDSSFVPPDNCSFSEFSEFMHNKPRYQVVKDLDKFGILHNLKNFRVVKNPSQNPSQNPAEDHDNYANLYLDINYAPYFNRFMKGLEKCQCDLYDFELDLKKIYISGDIVVVQPINKRAGKFDFCKLIPFFKMLLKISLLPVELYLMICNLKHHRNISMALNDVATHSSYQRNMVRYYLAKRILEPNCLVKEKSINSLSAQEMARELQRGTLQMHRPSFGYSFSMDRMWKSGDMVLGKPDEYFWNRRKYWDWRSTFGDFATEFCHGEAGESIVYRPSTFLREARHAVVHLIPQLYAVRNESEEDLHNALDACLNQAWPLHLQKANTYAMQFENSVPPSWVKSYPGEFEFVLKHNSENHKAWTHFNERIRL